MRAPAPTQKFKSNWRRAHGEERRDCALSFAIPLHLFFFFAKSPRDVCWKEGSRGNGGKGGAEIQSGEFVLRARKLRSTSVSRGGRRSHGSGSRGRAASVEDERWGA